MILGSLSCTLYCVSTTQNQIFCHQTFDPFCLFLPNFWCGKMSWVPRSLNIIFTGNGNQQMMNIYISGPGRHSRKWTKWACHLAKIAVSAFHQWQRWSFQVKISTCLTNLYLSPSAFQFPKTYRFVWWDQWQYCIHKCV